MSVAAKHLFMSTAAVSQQIKKLEESLGEVLFYRTQKSLKLTPVGQKLVEYGRQFLRFNDKILTEITSASIKEQIRVGIPEQYLMESTMKMLNLVSQKNPTVKIDLKIKTSKELFQSYNAGAIDVLVYSMGVSAPPPEGHHVIGKDEIIWASTSTEFAFDADPTLPLAVSEADCPWNNLAFSVLANSGIRHDVVFASNSIQAQLAAVKNLHCLAPLPRSIIKPPLMILNCPELPHIGYVNVLFACQNVFSKSSIHAVSAIERFFCHFLEGKNDVL